VYYRYLWRLSKTLFSCHTHQILSFYFMWSCETC